jgi:hypothetical protein
VDTFNLLNHAEFADPVTNIASPQFGQIGGNGQQRPGDSAGANLAAGSAHYVLSWDVTQRAAAAMLGLRPVVLWPPSWRMARKSQGEYVCGWRALARDVW